MRLQYLALGFICLMASVANASIQIDSASLNGTDFNVGDPIQLTFSASWDFSFVSNANSVSVIAEFLDTTTSQFDEPRLSNQAVSGSWSSTAGFLASLPVGSHSLRLALSADVLDTNREVVVYDIDLRRWTINVHDPSAEVPEPAAYLTWMVLSSIGLIATRKRWFRSE